MAEAFKIEEFQSMLIHSSPEMSSYFNKILRFGAEII